MTISEFFASVYSALRLLGRSPETAEAYRVAVNHWRRFDPFLRIDQVDDLVLARFAAWHLQQVAPPTVNKTLRHLRAILRLAHKRKMLADVPDMPWLPETLREPEAFLLSEIRAFVAVAAQEPGHIANIPAGLWWVSLLLCIYDSGGRIGAVIGSDTRHVVLEQRYILLVAERQKQRRAQRLGLSEESCTACRLIYDPDRPLMWPWPHGDQRLNDIFRSILLRAGVTTWRGTGSLFHRIRKSTASYMQAAGGNAMLQLGHSCQRVTDRYLDSRICGERQAADLIPRIGLTF